MDWAIAFLTSFLPFFVCFFFFLSFSFFRSFSSALVLLDFEGADCYAFGKLIAAIARLVVIAQSLGDQSIQKCEETKTKQNKY